MLTHKRVGQSSMYAMGHECLWVMDVFFTLMVDALIRFTGGWKCTENGVHWKSHWGKGYTYQHDAEATGHDMT